MKDRVVAQSNKKTLLPSEFAMSHADVGDELGLHEDSVKRIERIALRKLRALLKENGYTLKEILDGRIIL